LKRQPRFKFEHNGVKIGWYSADFEYEINGVRIIEDYKSKHTRSLSDYKKQKRMLKAFHNIEVFETDSAILKYPFILEAYRYVLQK